MPDSASNPELVLAHVLPLNSCVISNPSHGLSQCFASACLLACLQVSSSPEMLIDTVGSLVCGVTPTFQMGPKFEKHGNCPRRKCAIRAKAETLMSGCSEIYQHQPEYASFDATARLLKEVNTRCKLSPHVKGHWLQELGEAAMLL